MLELESSNKKEGQRVNKLNIAIRIASVLVNIGAFIAQMNDLIPQHIFTSLLLLSVAIPQLYSAWETYTKNGKELNLTAIAMIIVGVFCIISGVSVYFFW